MPDLSTTYDHGAATTRASQYEGSGANPLTDLLKAYALRRMGQINASPPVVAQPTYAQPDAAAPPRQVSRASSPASAPSDSPRKSYADTLADEMEARQRIIAADEATRPAPMRMMPSQIGINGGYVLDDRAMDANQRKMFLPQSAQFAGGGGGGGSVPRPDDDNSQKDPLADPYSDAYREMISRGMTPADIAATRQMQMHPAGR